MDYKKEFESIARKYIKRDGLEKLLESLAITDFYLAPASTRYHDSCEHGLVIHSLNVFNKLYEMKDELIEEYKLKTFEYDELLESIAIVSLFHDVCKIGFYAVDTRNTKDENGKWIQVPYYTVDNKYPFGHGEKSVFMLMSIGLRLTDEEAMAIRWHMGGFEPRENHRDIGLAYEMFPIAVYLQIADMKATYLSS